MSQEDSEIKSKRMRLVDTEDFSVDLEYNENYAILHLPEVPRFTKTVLHRMQMTMEDLNELFTTMGYPNIFVAISPNDPATEKLVMKLGFVHLADNLGMKVYVYNEFTEMAA